MKAARSSFLVAWLAALLGLGLVAGPSAASNNYVALRLPAQGQSVLENGKVLLKSDAGSVTVAVGFYLPSFSSVKVHFAPLDATGRWTNVQSRTIQLASGQPGDYYMKYGAVTLSGLTRGARYEFVIEAANGTWYKVGAPGHENPNAPRDVRFPLSTSGVNGNFSFPEPPAITVLYPGASAIITTPTYSFQVGANPSTNSVRVRIADGEWRRANFWNGTWWFDWSGYTSRAYSYVVEGWNAFGERTEVGPYTLAVQLASAPSVAIEFPPQNSSIALPYSVNMVANTSTDNVRVRIDGGAWTQCTYSGGRWWYPLRVAPGPHHVVAEAWSPKGERYETPVRYFSVQ